MTAMLVSAREAESMSKRSSVSCETVVRPVGELQAAEAALVAAAKRLRLMTVEAVCGRAYDPDAFDAAVIDLRRARGRALTGRLTWLRWRAQPLPLAAPAA
jgi:hypothetical protein